MVHRQVPKDDPEAGGAIAPAYTHRLDLEPIPKFRMPEHDARPETVYRLIHDELLLDGSSRLNLATFVTTWMEPEADRLMAEAFDKNMIDKDEYPQTAEIERRCVNMVAHLFNAPEDGDAVGASTIGSSEAVMLAGLAMKWRWRARREAAGKPTDKPNLDPGIQRAGGVGEVLPLLGRRGPVHPDARRAVRDLARGGGRTHRREHDRGRRHPGHHLHRRVRADRGRSTTPWWPATRRPASTSRSTSTRPAAGSWPRSCIPNVKWDFRLPMVKSINVSGHKYGLTYPGVGFVVWRSAEDLPEDLVFHVNYLGGDMPTFTLNFSRPGNQIIGQYYNFLRLGMAGYRQIMETLRDLAVHTSGRIAEMGPFELVSDGTAIPVFAFALKEGAPYTVFDVSERLRIGGWQVPAYTMPEAMPPTWRSCAWWSGKASATTSPTT